VFLSPGAFPPELGHLLGPPRWEATSLPGYQQGQPCSFATGKTKDHAISGCPIIGAIQERGTGTTKSLVTIHNKTGRNII
jgi:hypothetical protein